MQRSLGTQWTVSGLHNGYNGYIMVSGCTMGIQWSMGTHRQSTGIQLVFIGYPNMQWGLNGNLVGTQQPPLHPMDTQQTPLHMVGTKWAPWHPIFIGSKGTAGT